MKDTLGAGGVLTSEARVLLNCTLVQNLKCANLSRSTVHVWYYYIKSLQRLPYKEYII